MKLIDLVNIQCRETPDCKKMENKNFSISTNETISLESKYSYDAHRFIKLLATLTLPEKGSYHYKGKEIDLKNYKMLLDLKKKIAYIAQDAGLVSNRTIKENILLSRFYFEDSLSIELDDLTKELIDNFSFKRKLDLRPYQLNHHDILISIFLREISKSPEVILMYMPENLISQTSHHIITSPINKMLKKDSCLIFFSYDKNFWKHFECTKKYAV